MNNKFKFVDYDETKPKEEKGTKEESVKNEKKTKMYFSFEARVAITVSIVLTLFLTACILIYKVVNHTVDSKVGYDEATYTNYEVCLKNNTCENENSVYRNDEINIIKVRFRYNIRYDKEVKYNLGYHVVAVTRVYSDSTKQILTYNKEKTLADEKNIIETSDNAEEIERVTIDFSKYQKEVEELYGYKEVEVALYLDETNETRKVASTIIPLSEEYFQVEVEDTGNFGKEIDVRVSLWDSYSILLSIIASVFIIISLIIIYKVTRLVLRVTNNKTIYQQELDDILTEYDDIIVVARDGYESNVEREVVKLESFVDLLEKQRKNNKPIIYSKINDIKCEFLLEDDKLYKVVMKESDYE